MDPQIVQAAEQQMRRAAPDEHTTKRRKIDGGEAFCVSKLSSSVQFFEEVVSAADAPQSVAR